MSKQIQTYEGMQYVKAHYAERRLSDTEFALLMTTDLNRAYSCALVRSYRKALGIANGKPSVETMSERFERALSLLTRMATFFEPVSPNGEAIAQEVDTFLAEFETGDRP